MSRSRITLLIVTVILIIVAGAYWLAVTAGVAPSIGALTTKPPILPTVNTSVSDLIPPGRYNIKLSNTIERDGSIIKGPQASGWLDTTNGKCAYDINVTDPSSGNSEHDVRAIVDTAPTFYRVNISLLPWAPFDPSNGRWCAATDAGRVLSVNPEGKVTLNVKAATAVVNYNAWNAASASTSNNNKLVQTWERALILDDVLRDEKEIAAEQESFTRSIEQTSDGAVLMRIEFRQGESADGVLISEAEFTPQQ